MPDELDTLVIRVRSDTALFARDVASMREQLDGSLNTGARSAGRAIESALVSAVRKGQLGFEDLRRVALGALSEIAASTVRANLITLAGGSQTGLLGSLVRIATTALGAPGRATGGPVVGGRPYLVGERGPELFVPSSSGNVLAAEAASSGRRQYNVTINVSVPSDASSNFMQKTGTQVARAVRAALDRAGD